MTAFTLQSPAFTDGDPIPAQYGYTEANVNPPLVIEGVPADAAALVLLVDDPDAADAPGEATNHWLVWDIDPSLDEIPEDWSPDQATEGQNDHGEHGYAGPNPVNETHTYRFRLYAVSQPVGLQSSASKGELVDAITGTLLESSTLSGTYSPGPT